MLSFSRQAGSNPSDFFQIAKYGPRKIFYHDIDNNKIDSLDLDDIAELVDDAVEELGDLDISNKKLIDVEEDLMAGEKPRDRKAARVYKKAKEILAVEESKIIAPDTSRNKIEIIPTNKENQVDTLYLAATNGAGKSSIAARYANNYIVDNPNNNVYLFAYKKYDPAYDGKVPNLVRIDLDRHFIRDHQDNGSINKYKNSLLIFDEVDLIEDKEIKNTLIGLKDRALQLGRANNTSVVSIQHKALGGKNSMVEFTECKTVIIFPRMDYTQARQVINKLGFNRDELASILDPIGKRQRWMAIIKPNIIVTENYAKIVDL